MWLERTRVVRRWRVVEAVILIYQEKSLVIKIFLLPWILTWFVLGRIHSLSTCSSLALQLLPYFLVLPRHRFAHCEKRPKTRLMRTNIRLLARNAHAPARLALAILLILLPARGELATSLGVAQLLSAAEQLGAALELTRLLTAQARAVLCKLCLCLLERLRGPVRGAGVHVCVYGGRGVGGLVHQSGGRRPDSSLGLDGACIGYGMV